MLKPCENDGTITLKVIEAPTVIRLLSITLYHEQDSFGLGHSL